MSKEVKEGEVVIVDTGQAGTIVQDAGSLGVWVLLTDGTLWIGSGTSTRSPQGSEDLAACPLEVDRFEKREKKPRRKMQ